MWALFVLFTGILNATVISPSSVEVAFHFESEFKTAQKGTAVDLIDKHAANLFGYMQNDEMVKMWPVNQKVFGIGAPAWKPVVKVLSDSTTKGERTIQYAADGRLLLLKKVAERLIQAGHWDITLPYDLDNFYDKKCTDKDYPEKENFWYFGDVFRQGCNHLLDLSKPVTIEISEIRDTPEDLPADLDELRVDNGHDLFQITTINGFMDSSTKRTDEGRRNYESMNVWLSKNGFTDTFISKYKNRPIHQFDKIVTRKDGKQIHIRLTRLLAETELEDNKDVTFAKFFETHLLDSDVIVYEGHSGLGVNLDLSALEKRAGVHQSKINPQKRQLFMFDSCSSYSYYLGMFDGLKAPGKLNVLSNGLSSVSEFEVKQTQAFYNILFDVDNNNYTWLDIINAQERSFQGHTYMMNLFVNQ